MGVRLLFYLMVGIGRIVQTADMKRASTAGLY